MVDGGEGEKEGTVEDFIKIGYAVEDCDEIGKACDEADDELGEDGFGDVLAGSGNTLVKIVASLTVYGDLYLGISSARWVTTSGVPTE